MTRDYFKRIKGESEGYWILSGHIKSHYMYGSMGKVHQGRYM